MKNALRLCLLLITLSVGVPIFAQPVAACGVCGSSCYCCTSDCSSCTITNAPANCSAEEYAFCASDPSDAQTQCYSFIPVGNVLLYVFMSLIGMFMFITKIRFVEGN
ncbi:hypothetical protein FRX97_05340 [Luteibaculum oceani]|uniref:Uncharacterized protein n=1 Tax=Luteibaculum oceani TaxID=1294296 RepID=A0A5C6VAB6_9FLAO|nr:hypothetical protein FRX97_05340 [Luteibaculum oceani]